MKSDKLSSLYEQIALNEASKSADLTSPKNHVVGDLKNGEEVFDETPQLVGGPEKQKIAKGPSYKISTSSETAPQATSSKHIFDGSSPAKSEKGEEAEEVKGTRVTPKTKNEEIEETEESHEDSDLASEKDDKKDKYNKYKYKQQESFTMNAFETLFKKTLLEQEVEDVDTTVDSTEVSDESAPEVDSELTEEPTEETEETEDSDLISDLKDLQDKLANILSRLEGDSEETSEEAPEEGSYDEEDFDAEFGDETESEDSEDEDTFKESVDKPKALGDKKKKLQGKDNKVSKIKPKGGKAYVGSFKNEPKPKLVNTSMPKEKGEVKSTVSKGDFIK
jgi:hypothetical protein